MKIILIRHGESVGNTKKGFISGRNDPEGLTNRGKVQIIRSAYELRKEKPDYFLASPVLRAQETAGILNHYFHKKIQTKEWLTELHHGLMEGSYWWEVIDQIPSSWRSKREDYTSAYPGGGESMKMLVERAWNGLEELFSSVDEKSTIFIVSHQAVIAALRFALQYGNPVDIRTPSQEDDFLQFIHSTKLPNGGFVIAQTEKRKLIEISEFSEFPPLKERKDNVLFYFKGLIPTGKINQIHTLPTASANAVYQISHDEDHILKILHEKTVSSATRQADLYTYLNKKNIPVPHVSFYDKSEVFYKDPVFVQDFVNGVHQGKCLKHHHKNMPNLLKDIYKKLEEIHKLPVEDVHTFWFPQVDKQFQSWRTFMMFNINLTIHYLSGSNIDKERNIRICDQLRELRGYIQDNKYARVPLQGDLAPENIIVSHTSGKLIRIIDFEWARIGDALWDYAYYYGWLEREDEATAREWHTLLEGKMSKKNMDIIHLYRILFHAWTMRDMQEYKGSRIRLRRGKRSREILETDSS